MFFDQPKRHAQQIPAYAVGTEMLKVSKALSLVSLGLFIVAGSALSIVLRRNEIVLLHEAEHELSDR